MRGVARKGLSFLTLATLAVRLNAAPLDPLAAKLARGAASLENKRIAVLAFPYHDDKISSGSTLLSERLTTCLVERKGLRVLERSLIEQLLQEKKLTETGVVDPLSLKTVGKILDAEAIVTGTLIDFANGTTEINARLIRTDTGEVLSAGRATVKRTWSDMPVDLAKRASLSRRRPEPSRAAEDTSSPEAPEAIPERRLSGTSLKLSNESFAPGRRHYLANESFWGAFGLPSGFSDSDTEFEGNYYPSPARSTSGHRGYHGTDTKTLPPTTYGPNVPLGTVRQERRTYSVPSKGSKSSSTYK